jgi:hypothetical protein
LRNLGRQLIEVRLIRAFEVDSMRYPYVDQQCHKESGHASNQAQQEISGTIFAKDLSDYEERQQRRHPIDEEVQEQHEQPQIQFKSRKDKYSALGQSQYREAGDGNRDGHAAKIVEHSGTLATIGAAKASKMIRTPPRRHNPCGRGPVS